MKSSSRRFSWNRYAAIVLVGLLPFLQTACTPKPWVKPYQRQHLADPIMDQGRNPVSSSYLTHVYQAREGARGAESTHGVGCGCN
ncbi:MAG: DUF4266 domain-containing protein [Gammaproteobacteria bacterium]|nr:MAG: DUF4266 domain-containing protein [Gammaproteobacteria bacterium]